MAYEKLFLHVKCKQRTWQVLFRLKYWATETKLRVSCLTTQGKKVENTIKTNTRNWKILLKNKPKLFYIQIRWVTKYNQGYFRQRLRFHLPSTNLKYLHWWSFFTILYLIDAANYIYPTFLNIFSLPDMACLQCLFIQHSILCQVLFSLCCRKVGV